MSALLMAAIVMGAGFTATTATVATFTLRTYPGKENDSPVCENCFVSFDADADRLTITGTLKGADSTCTEGAGAPAGTPDGCGIHIHDGTTCSDAALVGGHYFDGVDPWGLVTYEANGDGDATLDIEVEGDWSSKTIMGHAIVVHAQDGGRIGCGIIKPVTCEADRLVCPVPLNLKHINFEVEGNTNTAADCSQRGGGGSFTYFDLPKEACGVVQAFENDNEGGVDKILVLSAKLVAKDQSIYIGNDEIKAEKTSISCKCKVPLFGEARNEVTVEVVSDTQESIEGAVDELDMQMSVHTDSNFQQDYAGSELPSTLSRFYFQVEASLDVDYIGLISCTTAPTQNEGDASKVVFLQNSCASGGLDYKVETRPKNTAVRFSTLPFKFAGVTEIHVWCEVKRCADSATACGLCNRRLSATVDVVASNVTSTYTTFRAPLTMATMVLPVPVTNNMTATTFESGGMSAPAPIGLNITLYGCPMFNEMHEFAQLVARVAALWAQVPISSVQPRGVFTLAAADSTQRLAEVGLVDVVVVELGITPDTSSGAEAVSHHFNQMLRDSYQLTPMLRQELETVLLVPFPNLEAEVGAPRIRREEEGTNGLSGEEEGPDGLSGAYIALAAVGALTFVALAGPAMWYKRRSAAAKKRAGASKAAAAVVDSGGNTNCGVRMDNTGEHAGMPTVAKALPDPKDEESIPYETFVVDVGI